jgi:NADPH:quinone reductase-like Zn-dependent oxidoreductase
MSKAIRFSEFGGPEVLELVDVDPPQPGAGEVRVAVRAAGVNPADFKIRRGLFSKADRPPAPQGLGFDLSGTVDAVGEGVTAFAVGDAVLGAAAGGAYAELALARADGLVAKPAELSWEVAAAIGVPARTAYRLLELLRVGAGDTLLVHAATGGVGLVAVQLARRRGARVIGTASPSNHDFLRELGAEPVAYGEGLADRLRAVAPDGVDAVLDASGRGELPISIELAGGTERVITIAANDAAEHGVVFSAGDDGVDVSGAFPEIVAALADRDLVMPIHRRFPLAEAAAAHAESEAGHVRGKIVLIP